MKPEKEKSILSEKLPLILYIGITLLLLFGAVAFSVGHENGYRIKGFSIQKVSSVYMDVSERNTWVFINNTPVHQTETRDEALHIPDVEPGNQLISVVKDRYFPWAKRIDIPSDEEITLYPFLLRQNVEAETLTRSDSSYLEVWRHFRNQENTPQKSYETDHLLVEATDNGILTTATSTTESRLTIETSEPVRSVYQYKNNPNVVIYTTLTDIWVSELDAEKRLSYKIFEGNNVALYPKNDTLFVQSNNTYYRINL